MAFSKLFIFEVKFLRERSHEVVGINTDFFIRWRDPKNVYRTNWNVHNVPALVRFEVVNGEVSATGKLIEGEILDKAKLGAFLA